MSPGWRRFSRKPLAIIISTLSLCSALYFLFTREDLHFRQSQTLVVPSGRRISLVVIWMGDAFPYMTNFFESALANADLLEIVWIGVRHEDEQECYNPMAGYDPVRTSSIKVVCLSQLEYWTLHRDYFCQRWRCSRKQADKVLEVMLHRHDYDQFKSFFRLWRGYIFRKYIDPTVEWWGWADADIFLGNLRSQFPWDATGYDIIVPAHGHTLLYLRGQLCFFRSGSETENKLNGYGDLSSPAAYTADHMPDYSGLEEAEFSAFVFRDPRINFLLFPNHLIEIPLHLTQPKFATLHGVYRLMDMQSSISHLFTNISVLSLPGTSPSAPAPSTFRPTFSEEGLTRPVEILEGVYGYGVWFDPQFTNHYVPPPLPEKMEGWVRILGRGGGYEGGEKGVWERLEPPGEAIEVTSVLNSSVTMDLLEGLYIHWFIEKYEPQWFDDIPPLRPSYTLMSCLGEGAEVWNCEQGQVVWGQEGIKSWGNWD